MKFGPPGSPTSVGNLCLPEMSLVEVSHAHLTVQTDLPGFASQNMACDEELARRVLAGELPPTLRIYGWKRPAVTIGRRQSIEDLPADLPAGLETVRRPTGGGAVLHRTDELTYALALPAGLVSARRLPGLIHRALREELVSGKWVVPEDLDLCVADPAGPFTFCFEAPVYGDLLYRGRKAAGSAVRAWRDGLLLQGSIQGLPVSFESLRLSLVRAVTVVHSFQPGGAG